MPGPADRSIRATPVTTATAAAAGEALPAETLPVEKLTTERKAFRLLLASSNAGKLREYRVLAGEQPSAVSLTLELFPDFAGRPSFEETAPTFAENAAGKALHYSRFTSLPVMADDSGLVVTALGGAPGVYSARYAGPGATDAQRIAKLTEKLQDETRRAGRSSAALDRSARFVCAIALAVHGRVAAVLSDSVSGELLDRPRGNAGFGYDPVFWFPPLGKTFAEMSEEEKNLYSHRGKAFRKMLEFLASSPVL